MQAFQKIKDKINIQTELLSGLTVALALVPEAVAFSFVAGVKPLIGLYTAFIICFLTSILGGRPGMISGATGALAVVIASLVSLHGVQYLFATVILMGFIQILIGLLKLGKFIRLVPQPVISGFVNGLAIVIFLAQLPQFKTPMPSTGELVWLSGAPLYTMVSLVAFTMLIIYLFPKWTKAFPAALGAILLTSALTILFKIPTKTVGDLASISGAFPSFKLPLVPFTYETLKIIFPYALIMAGVGLIESLLTLTLLDEMTETRGKSNRECLAQGFSNVVTGFFGGMGGCAMIGQSMINVSSGARSRLSGIAAGVALLFFILFSAPMIEMVPVASLVGVMFMVCIGTFEWTSFKILHKIPKADAFVIVLVSSVTVFFDLAIAVLVGVIVQALVFSWESATKIRATVTVCEDGVKYYEIWGPLFFASTTLFQEEFDPQNDPENVVVDFKSSRIVDHSGIEALKKLTERYLKCNKKIVLKHLSPDCRRLLQTAGNMVQVNICEDPLYTVLS